MPLRRHGDRNPPGFHTGFASRGEVGAGGSLGFADPETKLGFAYVMNRLGSRMFDGLREHALRNAVAACL